MHTATKLTLLCLCSLTLLMSLKCKKEYVFPEETQAGLNTFGCKVDGKIWVPGGRPFRGPELSAAYGNVGSRHYFGVHATDNSSYDFTVVQFGGDSIEVAENTVYPLAKPGKGNFYGEYVETTDNFYRPFQTNSISRGEVRVTKFDLLNKIVAGTFWFTAVDTTTGKKVEITEGRFDMKF